MVKVYRKKPYNRKGKVLSKGNIYRKKSAYSQARQIAALNRKISKISKLNRPEITSKVFQATKEYGKIDTSTSTVNDTFLGFMIQPGSEAYYNYKSNSYAGGSFPAVSGQYLQIWGGSLKFSAQYHTASIAASYSANVRVVILMRKSSYNNSVATTNPASYIDNYTIDNSYFYHLYPLRDGITSEVKVLYDKFFKLDVGKNVERTFKFKLPRTRLEKMNNVNYPKYCIYGYIIVNGIDQDNANVSVDSVLKVNYSDNV